MKTILSLIAAVLLVACVTKLSAVTATVTVRFDPGAGNPANVEHYVQRNTGTTAAPVWTEVVKGTTDPLIFTAPNVMPGTVITVRVKSRLPGIAGSDSAPTNEASAVIPLNAPTNATILLPVVVQ